MSEPERPNSEDEKAVPMPPSGAARPAFRSSKMTPVLAEETLRSRIVSATALILLFASLKAKDAKGFLHALKHLVANRDEARQLAQAAREYALSERTTEAQVHLWRQAIDAD